MNDLHVLKPFYRVDEVLEEIRPCLESGWTGPGEKTLEFEQAWRDYTGLEYAHMVNSATAGLIVALRTLAKIDGWGFGSEIITTPLTFVSTNHAILQQGFKPVFADVDQYLCLDPADVERRITSQTRAVMFVGIGGSTGNLREMAALCKRHGLRLILDAAHMAGTRLDGAHVGAEADVAVFSFQAVKNLPTADSGMICFRDEVFAADARRWTWLGINKDTYTRTEKGGRYAWEYDVDRVGYKCHGNAIMAAMGLVALRHLDEDNAQRREIAKWYDEFLNYSTLLRVPQPRGCESSRHLYQVRSLDREGLLPKLHEAGIYPGVHYGLNTQYSMYRKDNAPCAVAVLAGSELISMPMHLGITQADVERIAKVVDGDA